MGIPLDSCFNEPDKIGEEVVQLADLILVNINEDGKAVLQPDSLNPRNAVGFEFTSKAICNSLTERHPRFSPDKRTTKVFNSGLQFTYSRRRFKNKKSIEFITQTLVEIPHLNLLNAFNEARKEFWWEKFQIQI